MFGGTNLIVNQLLLCTATMQTFMITLKTVNKDLKMDKMDKTDRMDSMMNTLEHQDKEVPQLLTVLHKHRAQVLLILPGNQVHHLRAISHHNQILFNKTLHILHQQEECHQRAIICHQEEDKSLKGEIESFLCHSNFLISII